MSGRQKIWDCIYPMVFILLCMAVCSAITILTAGVVLKIYDPQQIYTRVRSLSLWTGILSGAAVPLFQRKNFIIDEMRFGKSRNRWPVWKCIAAIAVTAVLGLALNFLIQVSGLENIFTGFSRDAEPAFLNQNIVLLIVCTGFAEPLAEELIFRGMTYRRIRYYLSEMPAVVLSSLMFGIYHGNMIQFIYATLMGIVLSLIYEKSGSLAVCSAAHIAANLATIALYPVV